MDGLVKKIVPHDSTVPTGWAQEFTTFKDGQAAMALHAVQGGRELVKECRSLARFTLRGIPPMVAGTARIRVTFQMRGSGEGRGRSCPLAERRMDARVREALSGRQINPLKA
jgi:molecular chaperone HscA